MTQSVWYLFLDGKVVGPKHSEEIRELLWTGDISNNDPIFKMGEPRWTTIRDIEEFKPQELSALSLVESEARSEGEWVVLTKRQKESSKETKLRFLPIGPFSTRQISEKLQSGEFQHSDYIWKEGWSGWTKISETTEFGNGSVVHEPLPLEPQFSLENETHLKKKSVEAPILIQNPVGTVSAVVETKPTGEHPTLFQRSDALDEIQEVSQKIDPPFSDEGLSGQPAEVGFEDRAESTLILPPESPYTKKEPAKIPDRATDLTPIMRPKRNRLRLAVLFGTLATLFLCLHFLLIESPARKSELVSRSVASVAPPKTAPPKVAPTPPEPSIKIVPLKLDSAQPQLAFETNAQPDELVQVELRGESGQVLEVMSYHNQTDLKRSNYDLPILDLAALHLPTGKYHVVATLKTAVDERDIFVGDEGNFQKKIMRHRKQIAYQQQIEKLALYRALFGLNQQIKDLKKFAENPNGKKKALEKWIKRQDEIQSALKRLQDVGGDQALAYPDLILSAASSATKIQAVQMELFSQTRDIASDTPRSVDPSLETDLQALDRAVKSLSSQSAQ